MKLKNRLIFATLVAITAIFATACSKDPLEGVWKSEHMILKFKTSSHTVSLCIPAQQGVDATEASGTYSIDVQEKLLVRITHHVDSKMDYTERSKKNGEYQLAALMLRDGKLILSDFYGTSLTLSGGEGKSIQDISGTWSYTEEDFRIELTLDPISETFLLQEFSSDPFITDEKGVVLDLQGTYRTESFTAMTMNMKNSIGFPYYSSGEMYFSEDRKTLYLDGQSFHK